MPPGDIPNLRGPFEECATATSEDVVHMAIHDFLEILRTYKSEDEANNDEGNIRRAFIEFLDHCDFLGTKLEFEKMLDEIGGPSALREDGTISYFHQLGPIVNVLALIECGELSLRQLTPYGGIEGMMRGHLRHDSVENAVPQEWFTLQQLEILDEVQARRSGPDRAAYEQCVADGAMMIVGKLTKKEVMLRNESLVLDDKGKLVKIPLFETTEDYMNDIIPEGLAYALKLADGSNNISSMLGAEKFTPEKRLEYALERWTMFGAEMGFSDKAMEKSADMADTIGFFDSTMGVVLYTAVGYARYVDQLSVAGQPRYDGQSRIYESGIGRRYIAHIVDVNVPPAFDNVVTKISRIQKRANDRTVDPAERTRIKNFLNFGIYPAIRPYAAHYPTLQIPANEEIQDNYAMRGNE